MEERTPPPVFSLERPPLGLTPPPPQNGRAKKEHHHEARPSTKDFSLRLTKFLTNPKEDTLLIFIEEVFSFFSLFWLITVSQIEFIRKSKKVTYRKAAFNQLFSHFPRPIVNVLKKTVLWFTGSGNSRKKLQKTISYQCEIRCTGPGDLKKAFLRPLGGRSTLVKFK